MWILLANKWQQCSEWPFQLSELKFDSLLQLELVFVFAAIWLQSKNHVQRPVKCATGWSFVCAILLQSCKCAFLQSHNRAILQMCNRAILVQAEDLPSVSRLLLCKRATFCPTHLSACGYNSQLRGENEHLAWRQELVRMARSPPQLITIATIASKLPECHFAGGATRQFCPPPKLAIGGGG